MRSRARVCTLIVACLALSGAATADSWVVFSKDEIAVIQGYYAQHPVDAGKGAQKGQKSKPLPPGIAKNLARGKPLPPGIAKQHLPEDLDRQLPPVHAGYQRVYVDGRVLLVDIATQVIHDVLMEAVTN
jgi:Ni/Co efflux regulator RcnB